MGSDGNGASFFGDGGDSFVADKTVGERQHFDAAVEMVDWLAGPVDVASDIREAAVEVDGVAESERTADAVEIDFDRLAVPSDCETVPGVVSDRSAAQSELLTSAFDPELSGLDEDLEDFRALACGKQESLPGDGSLRLEAHRDGSLVLQQEVVCQLGVVAAVQVDEGAVASVDMASFFLVELEGPRDRFS